MTGAETPDQDLSNHRSPRHEEALRLAAEGFPVFPCVVGGKIPATPHGFEDKTTDTTQINAWWSEADYNLGIVPHDMGLAVADLDLYKPDGVSKALLDMLPATLTHVTPQGGEHRLYLSIEPYSNRGLGVNADVRSAAGYILWPPSVVNEVEYRIVDDRVEPVMLPEAIRAHLGKKQDKSDVCQVPDDGIDHMLPEAREWCARYAENQSNDRFVAAAALTRNFGLTNATATELCAEFGIRMHSEQVDGTTWEQTLDNARKHGEAELGTGVAWEPPPAGPIRFAEFLAHQQEMDQLARDYMRDPSSIPADKVVGYAPGDDMVFDEFLEVLVPTSVPILAGSEKGKAILDKLIADLGGVAEEPPAGRKYRWPRRGPVEAKDQPPMVWLDADNLFPSGPRIMVIYAEKANLKTQFALAKSLEIVTRTKGRVLYIAAEDGHGVDTQRLPAYVEKRGVDWQTLDDHWWSISEPIDLIGDSGQLIADVREQGFAPDVVVIDVMTACTGAVDINLPGVGNSLMNAAQRLANAFNALVVLLTHPGKDDTRGPVGSYAFTARADVVLLLNRQKEDTLAVTVEKMKSGPGGHTIAYSVDTHDGIPLVGGRKAFERKTRPTDDEAITRHLVAAGAFTFAAGLSDQELAERIIGDMSPGEDGAAHATRVARLAEALKFKHRKPTHLGEKATMTAGHQLYWRWHLGKKV
jgi:hypothetical protein